MYVNAPELYLFFNRLSDNNIEHIKVNNILLEKQFRFRPATATDNASFMLINEILDAMNQTRMLGGIFCDMQKAFDCVNHNILLAKLEFYGVTGRTLQLIKWYLEGRFQKVVLDNNFPDSSSHWGELKHGIPQGSILGPLLFLLVLYADDTSIIFSSLTPTNFISSAKKILQDINKWFTSNLLSLNADKTQYEYMQFATKTSSLIDLHLMCKKRK
jgi:hypothetical protein